MLLIQLALNIAPLQHVVYKHFITQLRNKKMSVGVTAVAFFILSYFEPHCKSRASLRFEVLQHPQCLPNCGAAPPKPPLAEKRRSAAMPRQRRQPPPFAKLGCQPAHKATASQWRCRSFYVNLLHCLLKIVHRQNIDSLCKILNIPLISLCLKFASEIKT